MSFPLTLNIGGLNIYGAVGRTTHRIQDLRKPFRADWISFFSFAEVWVGVARDRLEPLWLQHSRGAQNYELVIPGFGLQLQWSTPYVIPTGDFYRASNLPECSSPWPQSRLAAHRASQMQNLQTENLRCKVW